MVRSALLVAALATLALAAPTKPKMSEAEAEKLSRLSTHMTKEHPPAPPQRSSCDFTLELSDTWGDGWYNWNQEFHYLEVTLDGAAVLPEDTVITIAWDGEEADTFF